MILQEWIKKFCPTTDLAKAVQEKGTAEDLEFLELIKLGYDANHTRLTIKYKQIPNNAKTEQGIAVWDAYGGKLRDCRGITFDLKTGEIILYPFEKFFEIDQVEESSLENVQKAISKAKLIEFSEKLDGSLTSMRWYNNALVIGTMGMNESELIEQIKKDVTKEIIQMCKDHPERTFIFEELETENTHVVQYKPEELGLYLLGYRDMNNYYLSTYKEAIELAKKYNVRHTTVKETTLEKEAEVLSRESGYNREGCVINIDGWRVKLKSEDYKVLHFTRTAIGIKEIIKNIANDSFDEIYENLSETNKLKAQQIIQYKERVLSNAKEMIKNAPEDRKEFFTIFAPELPKAENRLVVNYYLKGEWLDPLKTKGGFVQWKEIEEYLES